jgi:ATP-dependent Clp protease protease subunit
MAHKLLNESEPATLYIYDPIAKDSFWGDSVSAKDVIVALDSINAPQIQVRINSPGGDVFEGDAIYNALRRKAVQSRIIVCIDGVAASAASFIAMAGDEIEIAENAFMMIHESWTYAMGNKREVAKTIDLLSKVDVAIATMMSARSGQSIEDVTKWMEAETWFDSKEAVDKKFADRIGTKANTQVTDATARAAARWSKTPAAFKQSIESHMRTKTKEIEESPTPRLAALRQRMRHVQK